MAAASFLKQAFAGPVDLNISEPVLAHWVPGARCGQHLLNLRIKFLFGVKTNTSFGKFLLVHQHAIIWVIFLSLNQLKKVSLKVVTTIRRANCNRQIRSWKIRGVTLRPQTKMCRIETINIYIKTQNIKVWVFSK